MAASDGLTLVTICRNAAVTIRRTVDSVLAQQLRPAEYLFVDGESEDGTLELLAELLPRLEAAGIRGRVLHQHCPAGAAGIPHAWNLGLEAASGGVIGLLNADDWYEPETLAAVMAAFREHPECEAVACPVAFRTASGEVRRILPCHPLGELPWRMPMPHPGCFFTAGLYRRIGLYDTRYRLSADYDFIWRCRRAGVKWQLLDRPLVNMQEAGAADAGRALARRETLAIARRHAAPLDPRPYLAWLLRLLAGR